MNNIMWLWLRF